MQKETLKTDRKLSHDVAERLKKEDDCCGNLVEDIKMYINSYGEAADDYDLSPSQKYKYFHNI